MCGPLAFSCGRSSRWVNTSAILARYNSLSWNPQGFSNSHESFPNAPWEWAAWFQMHQWFWPMYISASQITPDLFLFPFPGSLHISAWSFFVEVCLYMETASTILSHTLFSHFADLHRFLWDFSDPNLYIYHNVPLHVAPVKLLVQMVQLIDFSHSDVHMGH